MRIAVAQMNPTVGDLDGNLSRALQAARDAADRGADLIVFGAHALTGAPIAGLGNSAAFIADAQAHLGEFAAVCPVPALISCVDYVQTGTEEEPDEELVCVPCVYSVAQQACEPLWIPDLDDPQGCPVLELAGERIAVLHEEHFAAGLQEDCGSVLVEMSADAYDELAASPAAWGRLERQQQLATLNNVWVVDANLCGAADALVFAGNSTVVAPDGTLVYAAPLDASELFVFDTDEEIEVNDRDLSAVDLDPCEILWRGLVVATHDYFEKNGFTDALVGLSGGLDSALVAAIAVDALGAEHVHGLLMPGPYSSEGSITDALELAENMGFETETVSIDAPLGSMHATLADVCGGQVSGLAAENLQARVRATYLLTVSNARGWLVLNTGNKSEAAMGFSTLGGDTCGVFAPIGDIYKTDAFMLARWRAAQSTSIPQACIDKPPSAELYPDARDEDRLPPYELLDALLTAHVEGNLDASELVARGHDPELVERVLSTLQRYEFKRRLEPMAPSVVGRSLTLERAWPVTCAWHDKI